MLRPVEPDYLEAQTASYGIDQIYLLTETAVSLFSRRNYREISRGDTPPEITSCTLFFDLCPKSAVSRYRRTRHSVRNNRLHQTVIL